MRMILKDQNWKVKTTIFWGERDRWLSYDGVEDFCKRVRAQTCQHSSSKHTFFELVPLSGTNFQVLNLFTYQERKYNIIYLIDSQAGHHVQEDSGEELAQLIAQVVGSRSRV